MRIERLRRSGATFTWAVLFASIASAGSAAAPAPAQPDRLAREVRALLSDRCFACHGPDSANRAADLRLDQKSSLYGGDYAVVIPGDPEGSELLRRIRSDDEWERMPPLESHLALSEDEISTIESWIAQGAPWAEHWAFSTPRDESPTAGGAVSGLDGYVSQRLASQGLEAASRADKPTLLRRVTLDLTGLPPTLAELDRFIADDSPDAYERVVERLLASPRFGERMATEWLDAARYADTYGYQADRPRRVWPWRDWVVRAINDNLPYDDFLTWQIAGDLLPDATRDQRLATTFNRLHRETNEGGSIPAEFRAENVADRVNTLGAAVLGLTLECARCHDHKFDPISQRDYYSLAAYFNNTGELGLYSHYTDATPPPALDLATEQQADELARLEERVRELESQAASASGDADGLAHELAADPKPLATYSFDELTEAEELVGEPQRVAGVHGEGLLLDGENGWTGPQHAFDRSQPFSIGLWMRPGKPGQNAVVVHRSRAWLDAAGRGYQLSLDEGMPWVALVHFWPGNALAVRCMDELPAERWSHVLFTYDGSSRASGVRLYVDGEQAETEVLADSLNRTIRYVAGDLMPDKAVKLAVGHRFRDTGFKGGAVDDLVVFKTELTPLEVREVAGDGTKEATPAEIDQHRRVRNAAAMELAAQLREARAARDAFRDAIPQIAVMADLPERKPNYVLLRGAYDAPGEPAPPSPPLAIKGPAAPQRLDRLGLANWITDPANPLTPRVAVNRVWQTLFGRGLVATPNDFGSQGAAPTHPELLDWLAVRFVESGWDVKALVKRIVMSDAYCRSSIATVEGHEADPENRWLARGPSNRLSAESLRDSALAASGLLTEKLGGPPVHPFQPPGLWEEKGAATYTRDVGEGSHRRSLYTVWKRSSPPPSMMVFDAAEREVCVMRRQSTATPLQALVLLNDPQYVEAACALAGRAGDGLLPEQLARIWRIATSRSPSEQELELLGQLYAEQLTFFEQDPVAAREWLTVGDLEPADAAPERAAMAAVALAVLNHDAFVTKR